MNPKERLLKINKIEIKAKAQEYLRMVTHGFNKFSEDNLLARLESVRIYIILEFLYRICRQNQL